MVNCFSTNSSKIINEFPGTAWFTITLTLFVLAERLIRMEKKIIYMCVWLKEVQK
jgi:hypothetical protein